MAVDTQAGSPFRSKIFRALWIAALVSNLGSWMHSVGAAWLLTDLSRSPGVIALLAAASALPVFVLSLPAGALADVVDRRKLLLVTQTWMFVVAAAFAAMALLDRSTPALVLVLTGLLAVGSALNMPAWSAITPELVPREQLSQAIVLNGVAMNASQAIGPAIGGAIIAASGPALVFLLNAVSFIAVIVVVFGWKRAPDEHRLPPEHVFGAVRAGARYARNAPSLQAVLVRAIGFMLPVAALISLLPLIARQRLGMGAGGYGVLMGCAGVGAVLAAVIVPRIGRRASPDVRLALATVLEVGVLAGYAITHSPAVAYGLALVSGIGQMLAMSTLNLAAQSVLPGWVRGRGLALFMLTFQVAIAAGAFLWGAIATQGSLALACAVAAGVLLASLALLAPERFRLDSTSNLDMTPNQWPEPHIVLEPDPNDGPIMVLTDYHVRDQDDAAFALALHGLAARRRRGGAVRWGAYRDLTQPGRWVEMYVVSSWAEHLRQRARSTTSDRDAWLAVRDLDLRPDGPQVRHHLAGRPGQPAPVMHEAALVPAGLLAPEELTARE